ncbi:hypothetical protein GF362_06585 [Candidatus Dojkabacteria bacterium]|nr:hypothetical protein [Candidatus Dojkabacteria bacterium]
MQNNVFEETPTIVVFAGTHYGNDSGFQYLAYETGKLIAESGFNLANGAGLGLMEEVSKGAKDAGGRVFGVGLKGQSPNQYLDVYHERVGIHSRQSYLFSRGDAFIALPGGMGTLYETIETAELKKLSEVEQEPLIIINYKGFYNDLKYQLEKMRNSGFIVHALDRYIEFVEEPTEAIRIIKQFYKMNSKLENKANSK